MNKQRLEEAMSSVRTKQTLVKMSQQWFSSYKFVKDIQNKHIKKGLFTIRVLGK